VDAGGGVRGLTFDFTRRTVCTLLLTLC
jgi:hypothetical protein